MSNEKKKLHWVKLDNAAKIYPAARRKNWSNLFRQSVTLHEAAAALYLLYIDLATKGSWFLRFGLPVTVGLGVLSTTVVALVRYIGRGRLYIFGGAAMALGALLLTVELLQVKTFAVPFIGWSIYPLVVLILLGCVLIYLAINSTAREVMERKLFF